MPSCGTILEAEHSQAIHVGTRCLEGRLIPTCLQPLVDFEVAAVDNLLIVRLATTVPECHHSVLMHAKLEWQMHSVLQEGVAPEVATLEVDLVVIPLIHAHTVKAKIARNPRHSP